VVQLPISCHPRNEVPRADLGRTNLVNLHRHRQRRISYRRSSTPTSSYSRRPTAFQVTDRRIRNPLSRSTSRKEPACPLAVHLPRPSCKQAVQDLLPEYAVKGPVSRWSRTIPVQQPAACLRILPQSHRVLQVPASRCRTSVARGAAALACSVRRASRAAWDNVRTCRPCHYLHPDRWQPRGSPLLHLSARIPRSPR
jgi:hypothetical protein